MDDSEHDLNEKRHVPVGPNDVRESMGLQMIEADATELEKNIAAMDAPDREVLESVNVFETAKQDPVDRCTCNSEDYGNATDCPEHGPDKGKDLRVYPLVGVLAGEKVDVGTFEIDAAENWSVSIHDMEVAEVLEYTPDDERFSIRLVIDNKTDEGEAFIIDNKVMAPTKFPLYIEDGLTRHYIGNAENDGEGNWSFPYIRDIQADRLGFTEKVRQGKGWRIDVEDGRAYARVAHLDPDKEYEPWAGSPDQFREFGERFRDASRQLLGAFLKLEAAIQGEGSVAAAFDYIQTVLRDCTMDAVKLADNIELSAKETE